MSSRTTVSYTRDRNNYVIPAQSNAARFRFRFLHDDVVSTSSYIAIYRELRHPGRSQEGISNAKKRGLYLRREEMDRRRMQYRSRSLFFSYRCRDERSARSCLTCVKSEPTRRVLQKGKITSDIKTRKTDRPGWTVRGESRTGREYIFFHFRGSANERRHPEHVPRAKKEPLPCRNFGPLTKFTQKSRSRVEGKIAARYHGDGIWAFTLKSSS